MKYEEMVKEAYEDILDSFEKSASRAIQRWAERNPGQIPGSQHLSVGQRSAMVAPYQRGSADSVVGGSHLYNENQKTLNSGGWFRGPSRGERRELRQEMSNIRAAGQEAKNITGRHTITNAMATGKTVYDVGNDRGGSLSSLDTLRNNAVYKMDKRTGGGYSNRHPEGSVGGAIYKPTKI